MNHPIHNRGGIIGRIAALSCIMACFMALSCVKYRAALEKPAHGPVDDETTSAMKLLLIHDSAEIDEIVNLAMASPAYDAHPAVNAIAIDHLMRKGLQHRGYRAFILGSLAQAPLLNDDARCFLTLDMIRYLGSDGKIETDEWHAALAALFRCEKKDYVGTVLQELMFPRCTARPAGETVIRVDSYFAEMKKSHDRRLAPEDYFDAMVQALAYPALELYESRGLLRCFDRYLETILSASRYDYYPVLKAMHAKEEDTGARKALAARIGRYLCGGREPKTKNILNFIGVMSKGHHGRAAFGPARGAYADDASAFIKAGRDGLIRAISSLDDADDKKRAALFCLSTGLSCEGIVPRHSDIVALIGSANDDEAGYGLQLVMAAGKADDALEDAIAGLIRNRHGLDDSGPSPAIERAIDCLAAIDIRSRANHDLLVELLGSERQGVGERAAEALTILGRKAHPALIQAINAGNDFTALQALIVLKKTSPSPSTMASLMQAMRKDRGNRWIANEAMGNP
jgi:hypothetical protein